MNLLHLIINGQLEEAKKLVFEHLDSIAQMRLDEAKKYVAYDSYTQVEEDDLSEATRNPNIIRMGRIQKIRRRIRRNTKGKIVVQRNSRRSSIKGYRVSGNTVQTIPAAERLRKARQLKLSWKTTRKAKLRRTLLKRKMSMRRRASIGLR